jgi:hypothetical protein
MNRLKTAELTSGIGALVLGVGLGAMSPGWLNRSAGWITLAGLALHAFGMWDKHRIERHQPGRTPPWVVALYWICWVLLGVVLTVVVFTRG